MNDKKVWFITGAGRGMGVNIAKAALAAGHAVVATARSADTVGAALGSGRHDDDLLAVTLDVTNPADAEAAVQAVLERFGRIDVVVNNAGNFYAGFFEEISPDDFRAQIETTLFGALNVTRAALPVMRAQHAGLVVTISSTAGIIGQEFCTAYAAAKFGVEGWMESLTPEVAPFGIHTLLVEPGFFRTELLTPESTKYAEPSIDDYAERTKQTMTAWNAMNGQQGGDPAKLADALIQLANQTSRRCASPPAPTPWQPSNRRPKTSSLRPAPTPSCQATSPTTTPESTPSDSAGNGCDIRRTEPGGTRSGFDGDSDKRADLTAEGWHMVDFTSRSSQEWICRAVLAAVAAVAKQAASHSRGLGSTRAGYFTLKYR